MPTPSRVETRKLLVGEGLEERRFFKGLLSHLQISDVQVEEYGGKAKLSGFLAALPKLSNFRLVESLGVTRDSNGSVKDALKSIQDALTAADLPRPGSLSGRPRVSIWILPDNQNPGMLEDLCLAAITGDGTLSCVDEFFQCVQKTARREPKPMAKARMHAWLASQVVPDRRLAEAAEAGVFNWDHPAFDALKQFLRDL